MKKNKRVMIVLDFHHSAKKIIKEGYVIAKEMSANVVLVHVMINLVDYSLRYKRMEMLKLENFENFELATDEFLEKSKQHLKDETIETIVRQGDFAASILNMAMEMNINIIVLGSHSTKWLEEIVMGRITNEVLQQTLVPILVVPTWKCNAKSTFISLNRYELNYN